MTAIRTKIGEFIAGAIVFALIGFSVAFTYFLIAADIDPRFGDTRRITLGVLT